MDKIKTEIFIQFILPVIPFNFLYTTQFAISREQ